MYRRHFTIKMNEDFAISFVPEGSKIETVTKNRKIAVTGQLLQLFISAELLQDFQRYLPTALVSFSSELIVFNVNLFRRLLISWTFRARDSSSKSSKIFKNQTEKLPKTPFSIPQFLHALPYLPSEIFIIMSLIKEFPF